MGKSHQAGWVVLRGKRWYGYYRKRVINPETGEEQDSTICVPLSLKTQMTKSGAREALRAAIVKQTGQSIENRAMKDSSVTFEWFVRNRYFPPRSGDWRPQTAIEKRAQIEIDLIQRFGEYPLDSFDRFVLQTHLNSFAGRYSQDRVKQARSYLKSIFDEAIEQEFLMKDPSRKLRIPRNLRPKDKRILTWEQLGAATARAEQRDGLILLLEMTEALRPSELFAIRWRTLTTRTPLS